MFKLLIKLMFLTVPNLLVNGCASSIPNVSQSPKKLNYNRADSENGVILFSFSAPKSSWQYFFSLEILNEDTKVKTSLRGSSYKPDIKNDSLKISYEAVILPKGNYRLYNWEISSGQTKFFPKGNFSLPFTVFGGDVNYIGDYQGVINSGRRGGPGYWPSTEVYYLVSNRYNQDAVIVASKYPDVDFRKVLNSMPDFGQSNTKFSLMFLKGINIP
jgi:hypothetical protein